VEKKIIDLSEKLGVHVNPELLALALSHRSYTFENKKQQSQSNERLEFLGDAVLDLAIGDYLYRAFADKAEGELAKIRAAVVCEATLARRARDLDLGSYLLLGHGEEQTGGRRRPSLLADALEAVIGAIYLSSGFNKAASWIVELLRGEITIAAHSQGQDYKSRLQEEVQRNLRQAPTYEVLSQKGPDHAKFFQVGVMLGNDLLGTGEGSSKKEAEQLAARSALDRMGLIE
jgi:ribonuclease-3